MGTYLLSAAVAVVVFIVFLLMLPRRMSNEANRRKKEMLTQISQQAGQNALQQMVDVSLLKEEAIALPSSGVYGILSKLPGVASTFNLMLKAGLEHKSGAFLLGCAVVFIVLFSLFHSMQLGFMGFLLAFAVTFFVSRRYLRHRINKRSQQFLNLFPDAIDMIVRSVRSGHPLNTALRMIAENMEPPLSDEFKQVIDEVSYGRTLPEALMRMSKRVEEQDLNFFVVVLSVQQETGGSLAEVLANLSSVIRKRKQLRLKIHALTSEGRATSYILGGLPILEFCLLYWVSPGYLDPLFSSITGNIILGIAASLIVIAMWIVKMMINIDI
jgi:tight adherence protein B